MTSSIIHLPHRLLVILRALRTREKWFNGFGLALVFVSLITGLATYLLLTEKNMLMGRSNQIYWLIGLDAALLVALASTVGWRAWRIWNRSRQKLAGAQLHIQLTTAFSAVAAIPAILVAIFAVAFMHMSVQAWFGTQIHTAVSESQAIAQSYLQEHQQGIRADMLAMAGDMNRESMRLNASPEFLKEYFKTQTYLRNLSEALLVDSSGNILARAGISLSIELLPQNFDEMLKRAKNGEVVLFVGENEDRVRALVKLDNLIDTYLFVGRMVDEKVLARISMTNTAANAYADLEAKQAKLKLTMTLIFALAALMLLLVAIWAGLALAERIVGPVSRLVQASERVRAGDMNTRVDEDKTDSEINSLARAFNRMMDQLGTQRRDLLNANRQLDERRRFSEAVLAGVNAGILGMDAQGVIQIANSSAQKLLNQPTDALLGKKLADICPEMEVIRRMLRSKSLRAIEMPIDVDSVDAHAQSHWIVRMTAEIQDDTTRGYVVTFDDLSPLIDAQRKAAWSDVARRVAHEIKNPLTPIQLSAERLRKRYAKQITEDVETFEACTDTIIRHVDDIRHMVDEFSAFARMPSADKRSENLVTLCQQVIVLFQQAHGNVRFIFDRPEKPITLSLDRQQISQALTNVVKNAYESVQETNGEVRLSITEDDKNVCIAINDTGSGWPAELLPRLTDPYVTTKATGTGLGLSIVSKIIQDHDGHLEFKNNAPHGAIVNLILPKKGETKNG